MIGTNTKKVICFQNYSKSCGKCEMHEKKMAKNKTLDVPPQRTPLRLQKFKNLEVLMTFVRRYKILGPEKRPTMVKTAKVMAPTCLYQMSCSQMLVNTMS
jgi:hypothetical protein